MNLGRILHSHVCGFVSGIVTFQNLIVVYFGLSVNFEGLIYRLGSDEFFVLFLSHFRPFSCTWWFL